MSKRVLLALLLICGMAMTGIVGCSDDDGVVDLDPTAPPPSADVQLTCEGCHTSEAYLRATVVEDTGHGEEPEGEG